MKVTNPNNLPEPIVRAAMQEARPYDPNRIGVTTLIGPPLIRYYRSIYEDQIEERVEDMAWLIMGNAMAAYLEGKAPAEMQAEQKYLIEVDGMTITGIPDLHHNGMLYDYKVTSVWSRTFGKREWVQQLNCYAYILHKHGHEVKSAKIIAIYRDWNRSEAARKKDYPQSAIEAIDVPIWPMDEIEEYIRERVALHKQRPPEVCTPEERWRRPNEWAVMKEGRKSALRVLETEDDAIRWLIDHPVNGGYIVMRPGRDRRCEIIGGHSYCPVSRFCEHKVRHED